MLEPYTSIVTIGDLLPGDILCVESDISPGIVGLVLGPTTHSFYNRKILSTLWLWPEGPKITPDNHWYLEDCLEYHIGVYRNGIKVFPPPPTKDF